MNHDKMGHQILLGLTFIYCGMLFLFGLVNLFLARYLIGAVEIAVTLLLLGINLFFLQGLGKNRLPALFINIITMILAVYLYYHGGIARTGIYWCFVFPGLFISTRGLKRGAIWVGFNVILLSGVYAISRFGFLEIAYSGTESLTALLAYGFSCYILFSYEINRLHYKKEITRLKEHLPICSHCKKIRDKKGEWHSIENYLNKEADLDFSHGICPDCLKKYYPEFTD